MTGVERELLEIIAAPGGGTVFSGLSSVEASALNVLERGGLIESRPDVSGGSAFQIAKVYRITDAGRLALQAAEEADQQMAQQKAEAEVKEAAKRMEAFVDRKQKYRHDFKVAAFGAVLALLFEHYRDIKNLVYSALKALGLL